MGMPGRLGVFFQIDLIDLENTDKTSGISWASFQSKKDVLQVLPTPIPVSDGLNKHFL